jgi:hypothetical protein
MAGGRSLAYERLYLAVDAAAGDRRRLKRVRRRIRANRLIDETERAELLELAKYVPGCKPDPLMLDVDGRVRPVTYAEIMADRWDSETEGGLTFITSEEAAKGTLDPGPLFPPRR